MVSNPDTEAQQKVETEEERILRELDESEKRQTAASIRATAFMINELDIASERQNAAADRAAAYLASIEGKPQMSTAVSAMQEQHAAMDERMRAVNDKAM